MLKSKISYLFETHNCERICQGDILRDVKYLNVLLNGEVQEFYFLYVIVISQDCDLEQFQAKLGNQQIGSHFNQYLPNILLIPAYPAQLMREGNHLKDIYGITHERINTDKWKIVKSNNNERYHYFKGYSELQVPDLVCDFKHFFTIDFETTIEQYKSTYLATINELFHESLSQRFSNYLSRIGLPVL
jgi:hypothetical protein